MVKLITKFEFAYFWIFCYILGNVHISYYFYLYIRNIVGKNIDNIKNYKGTNGVWDLGRLKHEAYFKLKKNVENIWEGN